MTKECFISVDIEASGPIPGEYSMLSLGACIVGAHDVSFYTELKPISTSFDPAAIEVSGFDLAVLEKTGEDPLVAMLKLKQWIEASSGDAKPVFVGFNGCYDWQFVNWYFIKFVGSNPFGFGGIDIKSYFMGKHSLPWSKTTSSQLPLKYRPDTPQTHNALDDAKAQASIFGKMLAFR